MVSYEEALGKIREEAKGRMILRRAETEDVFAFTVCAYKKYNSIDEAVADCTHCTITVDKETGKTRMVTMLEMMGLSDDTRWVDLWDTYEPVDVSAEMAFKIFGY